MSAEPSWRQVREQVPAHQFVQQGNYIRAFTGNGSINTFVTED